MPGLIETARHYDAPLWIMKQNSSIQSITFFVSTDDGNLRAAELAIDVALRFKLNIKAIQVNPPSIIMSKTQLDKNEGIMRSIREISALYGITIQEVMREGNPVKETLQEIDSNELLVLSLPKEEMSDF